MPARIDCSDIPDLAPILALTCTQARGVSTLTGVSRLRLKECDRLLATQELLDQLGAKTDVSPDGDTLTISGSRAPARRLHRRRAGGPPHGDAAGRRRADCGRSHHGDGRGVHLQILARFCGYLPSVGRDRPMSSRIGRMLSVQIFGESHGPAVGVTLDGLPAGACP